MDAELYTRLGRIEAKMDMVLQSNATAVERHEALEDRVSHIERWKSNLVGKVAGGTAVASILGAVVYKFITIIK